MKISQERLVEIIAEELAGLRRSAPPAPQDATPPPLWGQPQPPAFAEEANAGSAAPSDAPPGCKKAAGGPSETLRRMQDSTAARIGIGRAGPRHRTDALLAFQADHAAARDAVLADVDEDFVERLGLFIVNSRCQDKDEYLTRPDLGRKLSADSETRLRERCAKSPAVQIFAAGGLSSVAIRANLENILPVLTDALAEKGIRTGTPFYAHLARVGLEDEISVLLDAEVICVLIGERPGLMTAESMSAYIAYRATPDMPESRRTVVSNIHRGGTNAVEAGAYIADIIQQILQAKTSGVALKR